MPLLRFSRRGTMLLLKKVRAQLPPRHEALRSVLDLLGQCRRGPALIVDQQRHPRLSHPEVLGHFLDRPDRLFVEVFDEFHALSVVELFVQHNVDLLLDSCSTTPTPKRR